MGSLCSGTFLSGAVVIVTTACEVLAPLHCTDKQTQVVGAESRVQVTELRVKQGFAGSDGIIRHLGAGPASW